MGKWENFSEEEIIDILTTSKTYKEVAIKFGYSDSNGQLSQKIRKMAQKFNVTAPYLTKKVHKPEDYIGEVHYYLKINGIDKEKTAQAGVTYFDCECLKCGKQHHSVPISCINKQKSCGCLKSEHFIEGHYRDLTGQTFQHLKVISLDKEKSLEKGKTYWKCQCTKCNKRIISVWMWDLVEGRKDNCGCYNVKSRGEERINRYLTELNIPFSSEYVFKNFYSKKGHYYRYDFAIFNNDNQLLCLIEYHGKQHYQNGWKDKESLEDIQLRDQIKEKYCKDNNIPLIIIPYTDYSLINTQYLLNKLKEVM